MLTLQEIQDHVEENGFGVSHPNDELGFSAGICHALSVEPDRWMPFLEAALKQVQEEDYGGFYEWYEEPTPGREYFICKSPFGSDIHTGIIAHRENGRLVLYFQFER